MPLNLTLASSVLKDDYQDAIRDQLNNDNPVIQKLVKHKKQATGKRFYLPVLTGRNNSVSYRAEGATLLAPDSQRYRESTTNVRYLYGQIQITGPTIKAMRNDQGAFVRAAESEMKGLQRDLRDQRARALFGDGTGRLALCTNQTGVNTLTLSTVKNIQVGQLIDIVNNAGTVTVANRTVTSLNAAARTITISGTAVTTAATDIITVTGNFSNEAMGLGGIVSDTFTLQGLNPTTAGNEFWRANILTSGSGRGISETLMRQAIDFADLAGGKIDMITTSHGVRAAYEDLLSLSARYVKPMELEGGVRVLEFDGMPIAVDRYHPSNTMYFLDMEHLDLYQLSDFEWMQDDKGSVLYQVPNVDAYQATMVCYETLVTYRRNAHSGLFNINETVGY